MRLKRRSGEGIGAVGKAVKRVGSARRELAEPFAPSSSTATVHSTFALFFSLLLFLITSGKSPERFPRDLKLTKNGEGRVKMQTIRNALFVTLKVSRVIASRTMQQFNLTHEEYFTDK